MSQEQVARNAAAELWLSGLLEGWGLSEPEQRAEFIVRELLDQGLRPVRDAQEARRPGPGSSEQRRIEAKTAIDAALAAARARRKSEAPVVRATTWQLTRLGELLVAAGFTDPQSRLVWVSTMVDRPLSGAKDLTYEEALQLIKQLKAPAEDDDTPKPSGSPTGAE